MDIFSVFTLFGGLAFFLYGMNVMSKGLERVAGGKFEKVLRKMTASPVNGLILGAFITCAVQSSSAVTVMLVGLVNSGIMQLKDTVAVIMGTNIGTTLTAWILSLSSIESENFWIKLLKPSSFSPLTALIGIALIMIAKNKKKQDLGSILVGFAILMYGMTLMGNAVSPLADMPQFTNILLMFNNPIIGVIVGTLFTALIQSSAASVGILQALSMTGSVTYGAAIPIIMGQNIGTCITSLLSSIGTNKNAKRVAAVHIYFNVIGTALWLIIYYTLDFIFKFPITNTAIAPVSIATIHSIFNIGTTIVLLPFMKQIEKLAVLTVREKTTETPAEEKYEMIDERLLLAPSFAIAECKNLTVKMAELSRDTLISSIDMLRSFNSEEMNNILKNEDIIDKYEDTLGTYLVKLSSRNLSKIDSEQITQLLHSIGDFERISDHAVNIVEAAREMNEKGIRFSDEAQNELGIITSALKEILNLTTEAFVKHDISLASKVEPLEQVIDELKDRIKIRHIERLQQGLCTIELGFILSDLLADCERVSDHCSNIAVCLIQINSSSYETHEYLNGLKYSGEPHFVSDFEEYSKKYFLK